MPDIDKPHKTGHNWLDIIIGVAVIAISVASLWVAAGESRTQQRILAASVWPYLQFGTGNATPEGKFQIDFNLINAGVGPARIKWLTLLYHDKPVKNDRELLIACCDLKKHQHMWEYSSGLQGRVLGQRENVIFIHMPNEKNDPAVMKKLNIERGNVSIHACFCSVLDDCWFFDSDKDEPTPVDKCPKPEEPLFEG